MGADEFLPARAGSLPASRRAAQGCQGCDLFKRATQTVFGSGPATAPIMLVGEQPGDIEDREGAPFVGPAGRLLEFPLDDVGLQRRDVYMTNVVKHFKWEPSGKRRLHKNPSAREVAACRPWVEAEINAIHPSLVVCLGATSARALLGPTFRVTRQRGEFPPGPSGTTVMGTVHPSAILRIRDHEARATEFGRFVDDLRQAVAWAERRTRDGCD